MLNTHWHFDHTGGNENLGNAGAVIVAQENVRKRMSSDGFIAFLGMKTQASPAIALPIVTFTRDASFHLNGRTSAPRTRPTRTPTATRSCISRRAT